MGTIAILLSLALFVAAWLYTVKKLFTMHAALRHLLGLLVGLVALFVAIVIFFFIGVLTPQKTTAEVTEVKIEVSAVKQTKELGYKPSE